MNILANRIMENCMFLESNQFFLPGIMLRDVSFDFQGIGRRTPDLIDSAKKTGMDFISNVIKEFKIDLDEELMWENYYKYTLSIRNFQKSDIEAKIYDDNLEFSDYMFKNLIIFLKKNQNKLLELDNTILNGIIDVIVRILHNQSCSLKNVMIYLYIQSLFGLYQYILRKNLSNPSNFKNDIETEIFPYVQYITADFYTNNINFVKFGKKLWNIIKRIRELYLIYKPLPNIT